MNAGLDALCRRHGIVAPPSPEGRWDTRLSITTQTAILSALGIAPEEQDIGGPDAGSETPRLAAPADARCFIPPWMEQHRAWGVAVQLYELRSGRNWGIGDFADLAAFARIAAAAGADFIGLNPLHALFGADPGRCSPFSPSTRQFLNPLYIAVDQVEGYAGVDADDEAVHLLRATERVDYEKVSALKLHALEAIWRTSWNRRRPDFDDFLIAGGEPLRLHAVFEALSAHMVAQGHGAGWRSWPVPFQDRNSAAVAEFADSHQEAVRFQHWLQYLCDRQLQAAQQAARDAGMRIGLYLDLAVGEAPDGSASWSAPEAYLSAARIGAPPDMFTAEGQDWGLTGISPLRVRQTKAQALRPIYEAAMRHAGAVRLDHAMGIWQLFLIPDGLTAAEGAYARLPADDVLSLLAELSQHYRTVLVGEDLGIVPDGFRDVLAEARILSYRVLYFEQDEDGFIAAHAYPRLALACIATHDLPTMKGWWQGTDIDLRERFALVDADAADAQREHRAKERAALHAALLPRSMRAPAQDGDIAPELVVEAHRFVARTPCRLAVARFADLAGEREPTNVPGTSDAYPNWQLKCAVPLEEIEATQLFQHVAGAMRQERPRR